MLKKNHIMIFWSDFHRNVLCKRLGWHSPIPNTVTVYGVNFSGICKYCGKPILRDSQGNWFEVKL